MSVRRVLLSLAAALCVGALTPGVASAATAAGNSNYIYYSTLAGETNNLTISADATYFYLTDSGPTVGVTGTCMSVNTHQARCPRAGINYIQAALGDLGDTATVADTVSGFGNASNSAIRLQGDQGNDTLTGGSAVFNTLWGGGDSTNYPGDDTLTGGGLNDRIVPGSGNDTVHAGAGNDQIAAGAGNDLMYGEAGFDIFDGGPTADGADLIDGGADGDSVNYGSRSAGISATVDDGANDGADCPGATCEGDNLVSISSIGTGSGNDTIIGTPGDDDLFGGDGNDFIDARAGVDDVGGGSGDDAISGGDGSDSMTGGDGNDAVDAGAGDDYLFATTNQFIRPIAKRRVEQDADSYAGGPGEDQLTYEGADVPLSLSIDGIANDGADCPGPDCENDNIGADVETLLGGKKADVMIGSDGPNEFVAGTGNDTIITGAGSDTADGGAGNDTIDAGAGSDTLIGAEGTDLLRSRDAFADQVDCGSSADSVIGDSLDQPESSCESFTDGITIAKSAKASEKKIKLELGCPPAEGAPCAVKVKLRAKGKTIATAKQTLAAGASQSVALRLSDDGAAVLRGPGRVHAQASATFTDAQGQLVTTKQEVLVR